MAYYQTCPECGAHLDPGESCECEKEEGEIVLKILDDEDLLIELGSARVFMKILSDRFYEIEGHYDENNWFVPDKSEKNLYKFLNEYEEKLELIRVIFDKLDEAYTYIDEKMPHPKKASVSPTKETTDAQTTTVSGCQTQHTTKTDKAQGVGA